MKRLQYRTDFAADFASKNVVLAKDEIGIERDTGLQKLGDGSTQWASLVYLDPAGASSEFNVRIYGARGDGVQNDHPAIQAAVSAANEAGGTVLFPAGTYKINAPIAGPVAKVKFVGSTAMYASTIRCSGNFAVFQGKFEYCTWDNLTLDSANHGAASLHVHLDHCQMRGVAVQGWTGYAMLLNDGTYSPDLGLLNRIQSCNIDSDGGGGVGVGIFTGYRFIDSWIEGCNIGSTAENINLEGGPVRILGCHLDGQPERNIVLRGNRRILIANNIIEAAAKEAIKWDQPPWETFDTHQQIQIVGNTFSNGGRGNANTYPAIKLNGLGGAGPYRGQGFLVTGNVFACEDAGSGWTNCLYGDYVKHVTVSGNLWYDGFMATNPVRLTNSTNYEVTGNGGINGVSTT